MCYETTKDEIDFEHAQQEVACGCGTHGVFVSMIHTFQLHIDANTLIHAL